jgi:predicted HicB family RNase H-like nuclease
MAQKKLVELYPEVHAAAKAAAQAEGMKLSGLVNRAVEKEVARLRVVGKKNASA